MLVVEAYAKINLSLEILCRRSDGYHRLVSIMQTVDLADTLTISRADRVSVTCSDVRLEGESNLAWSAAQSVRRSFDVDEGCHIHVDKRVPIAAGLGGGSSDAAASLTGLVKLWNVPASCAELVEVSQTIGSDVPFFLYGGTALVEGRGERITPIVSARDCWYLLVNPQIEVSTARVFRELTPAAWSDGTCTRALAGSLSSNPCGKIGVNGLQDTLFRLYPEARECFDSVQSRSPHGSIVSGSGPTVVGLFSDGIEAEAAAQDMKKLGYWAMVTTSCRPRGWRAPCA